MSYQSLIDDAISRARVKVASGLPQPTDKLASAVGHDNVVVEAEKIANALEYLALSVADDGTAVGAARADMVRDFFKTAAEADKKKGMAQPLVTETSTAGTQGVAPQAGKAKLNPQGLVGGNSPKQTTAPDGAMSRNALEQTPSASPTKSASLYDMLMGARMAKIADDAASPRKMDAEDKAPAHPMGQEGGHAQSPLSSTERIVAAKRKELHAPSRARLGEILAHAGDTAPSMASAQAIAPQAAAKGGLKVAASPAQAAKMLHEAKKDEEKKEGKKDEKEEKAEKKASAALIAREMFKQADSDKEEPTKHPFLASTAKGTLKGVALGGAAGLGGAYALAKKYPKLHKVLDIGARHGAKRGVAAAVVEKTMDPAKAEKITKLLDTTLRKPVTMGARGALTAAGGIGGGVAGAGLGAAYGMGRRKGRKDMSESN